MSKTKRQLSPWGKQCKVSMVENQKTLADIAEVTGYTKTYVSAIINGRVIVPDSTKQAISDALGVDLNVAE